MATILVTGVPGFLGSALMPRLLARDEESRVVCLVQAAWREAAVAAVESLPADHAGRVRLVEGDIGHADAGVVAPATLMRDVVEVFHLAAVYDLTIPAAVAGRVNVAGTRHVLELAARAPRLRRFHHVSTCYVSGRHDGVFREEDLDVGQTFKNHYEETKFRSEVLVRDAMAGGMPGTIYRPAAVVGDSADGATRKLDGPYMFIRLIVRQGRVALVPVVGGVRDLVVNIVPRDFVLDALTWLSGRDVSLGRTYHLADPDPDTVVGMLTSIGRAADARVLAVPLPFSVVRGAARWLPGVRRITGIPAEAIDYYRHRARYDTSAARADLAGSGIACPPFDGYVGALVEFVRAHPDLGAEAMV